MQALTYLHDLDIVHRDLKIENIIFSSSNQEHSVKLIDFGFAKFCRSPELTERLGTPYYMSPEVLKKKYDKRCDLWSLGVITFELLTGTLPFLGTDDADLDQKILTCDYSFDGP